MTTRLNKEVDITMTFIFLGRKTTSLLHLQNATCTYNNNFHFRQQVMQMGFIWYIDEKNPMHTSSQNVDI